MKEIEEGGSWRIPTVVGQTMNYTALWYGNTQIG